MSDLLVNRIRQFIAILYAVGAAKLYLSGATDRFFLSIGLLVLALGVFLNRPVALKTAGVLSLLFAVLLLYIELTPFTYEDWVAAGGIERPPLLARLTWIVPWEIFLVGSAYFLIGIRSRR